MWPLYTLDMLESKLSLNAVHLIKKNSKQSILDCKLFKSVLANSKRAKIQLLKLFIIQK